MAFSLKCQQLHPDPDLGPLKHDHSLTLIFFSLREGVLPNPWIKRGDPTVIWPRDWLPKEEEGLGDNILVLSVECYIDGETHVSVPLERILVRDLVMNTKWELHRTQTIVLVGHGLGGLVMKSLTIEVDNVSKHARYTEYPGDARCKAFKKNIKGIVLYSVPHTTSKEEFVGYCKSYIMMIQCLNEVQVFKRFNQHMVSLNEGFEKSIEQHIKLFAFVEGQKVMVPQFSTYKLVQNNVCKIEDADHFQVSQPLDHQHASYKRLLRFIQEDLGQALRPYLPREANQTSTNTNETKGVPNQQQKLDVMIRTIEDVHIKSPKDLQSLAPKEVLGETSIVCVGGKAKEGVEFLFMDVGDMAKVVGVGLDWAKVVVTKEFGVNVMQEDKGAWTNLWCLEHFVPRIITIPNPKQELVTHPNSTKTDGVELVANSHCVYVEDEKEENVHACFPLIFELAKHIGLGKENAMKMKEVSRAEFNESTKGGEVSGGVSSGFTQGGEVSEGGSSGSTKDGEVLGAEFNGSTKGGEVARVESSGSTKGGEVSGAGSSGSTKGGEVLGAGYMGSTKGGEVSGAGFNGSTKGGEISQAKSRGSTEGGEVSRAKSSGEVSGGGSSGFTQGGEVSRAGSSGFTKGGEVSGVGSSGSTKGGEVSRARSNGSTQFGNVLGAGFSGSTQGGEVSGAGSSGSTPGGEVSGAGSSGSTQEIRRNENDEGSEDPSRGLPNLLDPSLSIGREDANERTYKVYVLPKARQLAIPLGGCASPPSIHPILEFMFHKGEKVKTIDVKAKTKCTLEIGATTGGLGFYQDNITISLDCTNQDAAVMTAQVENVKDVKKIIINTSATNPGIHQVGAEISPFNLIRGLYRYTLPRGDNLTRGNTQEIIVCQLDCFLVDGHFGESEMKYTFRYPHEFLRDIALGDSSQIKTETTFWPKIMSKWIIKDENEESQYVFKVHRHIVSKEHLQRSLNFGRNPTFPQSRINILSTINERSDVRRIEQRHNQQHYQVILKVNHKMTHITQRAQQKLLRHSDTDRMIVEGIMEMLSSTSE